MITQFRRLRMILAAILALGTSVAIRAAAPVEAPAPQLSEPVSTALQKVNQFIAAEQWDTALLTVRDILKTAKTGTYDWAMTQLHVAQIHLSRNKRDLGDYTAAISALEFVLGSGYWPATATLDWKYTLAQLYLSEEKLDKAEFYVREWLAGTAVPTVDAYTLLISLVIQRSQADPAKPDTKLAEEALELCHKALLIGAKPNDQVFYLQAFAYQQLERWTEAAEVLELMLQKNPRNKSHWSQLFGLYINAENELRASITLERAHEFDAMNSPRENLGLAQLYYNMQQYDRAIEILEKGLGDATIEPVKVNWEMLGRSYLELHQEFKAIQAFLRADKHLDTGYFLFLAGNTYYTMARNADALKYFELAVKKGIDNTTQASIFAAFLAFELKEYDRASALLDVAEKNLTDDRQRADYKSLREGVAQGKNQVDAKKAAASGNAAP